MIKSVAVNACPKREGIRVCCMDMWDPYIASVKEWTNSDIVFGKFHVAKKVNEALDLLRRKEFTKKDPEERKTMKKKRFLVLRRMRIQIAVLKPEKSHDNKCFVSLFWYKPTARIHAHTIYLACNDYLISSPRQ